MHFGCATSDYTACNVLKEIGYDYIEFSAKHLIAMTDEEFKIFIKVLRSNHINCECLSAYCNPDVIIAGPGFDKENVINYAKKVAKRASEIGVFNVSIGSPFSRRLPSDYNLNLAKKQACQFFLETANVFQQYEITVSVEALGVCFCNFINKISEAEEIVSCVGTKNLGLVIDFYNMEQSDEGDLDLTPYIPNLFHVHISDDDQSPYRRDFLLPSKKTIHQNRIFNLYQTGYQGRISVEIDMPVIDEKAKTTFDILDEIRSSLRRKQNIV